MKKIIFLIIITVFLSCKSDIVEAEFVEINDNIARFDITNNTNQDIKEISLELNFLDTSKLLISKDTVDYKMLSDEPFLKSKDKTFIVNKVPENCTNAEVVVLEIDFMEKN